MRELADASDDESIGQRLYLSQIIAWCWYLQGRHRDLIALGEQMLGQAAKLSQPRPLMLALGVIATGYMGAGDVRNALSQREQTLAAALQTGDRISIAIARENLGFQFYLGGQFPPAREHLERALEIYRETASELRAVNARQH